MAVKILSSLVVLFLLPISVVAAELDQRSAVSDDFYASREVLATVYFSIGSAKLNRPGEQVLDKLRPRLEKIDPDQMIIRVEGIHPRDGDDQQVTLAMLRAKSVIDYLHKRISKQHELTLTGYSPPAETRQLGRTLHRADIVIYDNLFDLHHSRVAQPDTQ